MKKLFLSFILSMLLAVPALAITTPTNSDNIAVLEAQLLVLQDQLKTVTDQAALQTQRLNQQITTIQAQITAAPTTN